MITLRNINKIFNKGRANEVRALNDVNLEIKAGEFAVIVGSNGSGKSTLLNLIAGSLLPDEGKVLLNGQPVNSMADYRRSKWVARVFQNPLSGTAPDLSILDNFRLAAIRTQRKGLAVGINPQFRERVRSEVATLGMGLENKLDQPMGTLSGGQRQALTLLMSVTDKCDVLLLDEPTAALDPKSADVVMKTADKLIKVHSLTAVLITHNLKDAFCYGNRILQMAEGKIVRDISASEKLQLSKNQIFEWFS